MDGIIQMVPDADLSAEVSLTGAAPAKKTAPAQAAPAAKPAGTKTVALNLNDGDDDDAETSANTSAPSAKQAAPAAKKASAPVVADDDFMAEADAILNG